MRKRVAIPLTIAVIALIALPFLMKKKNTTSQVTYQTATVAKGTVISTVTGTGNLYADPSASVNATASGTVRNLKVQVGDTVTKGQVLFSIDDNGQLAATVSKSAASVAAAAQSVENAKTNLLQAQQDVSTANNKNTDKAGTVSDADLAILNQKVTAADAAVTSAQKNATSAQTDYAYQKSTLAKLAVTAPIDGTVTAVNVANGDTVGSGSSANSATTSSTAAVVIDNTGTLNVKVAINEVDASKVVVGQKASVTFDAVDGLTLTGKVAQIASTGTVTQGVVSYEAIIHLDSQDTHLRSQMTTTAVITTDVHPDVLYVPTTAVKSGTNGSYVEVLTNGTPRQQTVTTGSSSDTDTEITAGLTEGQAVVTSTVTAGSTPTATTGTGRGGGAGIPRIF